MAVTPFHLRFQKYEVVDQFLSSFTTDPSQPDLRFGQIESIETGSLQSRSQADSLATAFRLLDNLCSYTKTPQ
jgi:hypothetical protein